MSLLQEKSSVVLLAVNRIEDLGLLQIAWVPVKLAGQLSSHVLTLVDSQQPVIFRL